MGLVWNPLGVLGLAVGVAAGALALVVLLAQPGRRQNRRLALLLALDAFGILGDVGLVFLTDDPATAYAAETVWAVAIAAMPFAYLAFLSTLPSPLVRPATGPIGQGALALAAVAAPVAVLAWPTGVVAGVEPGALAPWAPVAGPWSSLLVAGYVGVSVVGLVVALSAWRGLPRGSAARRQASWVVAAFGTRDAGYALNGVVILAVAGGPGMAGASVVVYAVVTLAFCVLLAYGILQAQLFDIDLRLKRGLSRGLVASAFPAAFFVASEGLEAMLPVDGTLAGIAAAGGVALALRPLERGVRRLVDRLMPGVTESPAYVQGRKRAVYAAALEAAFVDGTITARERAVLDRLREELGLDVEEAAAVEARVVDPRPA